MRQIGHLEGDTVIGAGHKQAIVERAGLQSSRTLPVKPPIDLVTQNIITSLASMAQRVKIVSYDNEKDFADHAVVDKVLKSTTYFANPFTS